VSWPNWDRRPKSNWTWWNGTTAITKAGVPWTFAKVGRIEIHFGTVVRKVNDRMKKLIIFDLDGTLAESKSSLDAKMAALLSALLSIVKVAVISGGNWQQFKEQLLSNLRKRPG
jgi:hypothetical protein